MHGVMYAEWIILLNWLALGIWNNVILPIMWGAVTIYHEHKWRKVQLIRDMHFSF